MCVWGGGEDVCCSLCLGLQAESLCMLLVSDACSSSACRKEQALAGVVAPLGTQNPAILS